MSAWRWRHVRLEDRATAAVYDSAGRREQPGHPEMAPQGVENARLAPENGRRPPWLTPASAGPPARP